MSEQRSAARPGYLLSDDLLFFSRVCGTAQAHGLTVHGARSQAALEDFVKKDPPACVIVDLSHPGLRIAELVRFLEANCQPRPFVVAYGSHVDAATLQAARDAGCDIVWPRSKFVEQLPQAIAEWFAAHDRRDNGQI